MLANYDRIKNFSKILVTGPQRSGTTIAAYILANNLGYKFFPEEEIRTSRIDKLFSLFETQDNFVLQAPCMSPYCHLIKNDPKACVVFMIRNHHDIHASMVRVGWNLAGDELKRYFKDTGDIVNVTYWIWDHYQKKELEDKAIELRYDQLENSEYYVPKEQRKIFGIRQISPNVPHVKEMTTR